jgi:hypothetical protein
MEQRITVSLDLTSTTNNRSVSEWVMRPSWAVSCSIHAAAAGWGTGTPAVAEVKRTADRGIPTVSFSPAITFSANGIASGKYVGDANFLRVETTTAGSGGSFLDRDAQFTFTFTDKQPAT